uniref:Radical SAM core domain-containing protein n=1 Tax=Biomphalaria glabrata TaxID=6526 RepID=A0A2C9KSR8_BIOGL
MDELLKGRRSPFTGLIISGGEPLLQLDSDLLDQLSSFYEWIDIETNGTVPFTMSKPDNVFLSCSPKLATIKLTNADWYKVLIPDKQDLLRTVEHLAKPTRIYVQPVEVGGYESAITQENIRKCLALCSARGYRLSLQLHKVVGVR